MLGNSPPRLSERLLALLISDRATRVAILGDLEEEFHSRSMGGSATQWYWLQTLRSIPWLLCTEMRIAGRDSPARLAVMAIGGCAIVTLLGSTILQVFDSYGLAPNSLLGFWGCSMALLSNIVAEVVAGYVAARLSRHSPLGAAVALGCARGLIDIATVLLYFDAWTDTAFYRVSLAATMMPAIACGGILFQWQQMRRERVGTCMIVGAVGKIV
jgi:hypothetical protein